MMGSVISVLTLDELIPFVSPIIRRLILRQLKIFTRMQRGLLAFIIRATRCFCCWPRENNNDGKSTLLETRQPDEAPQMSEHNAGDDDGDECVKGVVSEERWLNHYSSIHRDDIIPTVLGDDLLHHHHEHDAIVPFLGDHHHEHEHEADDDIIHTFLGNHHHHHHHHHHHEHDEANDAIIPSLGDDVLISPTSLRICRDYSHATRLSSSSSSSKQNKEKKQEVVNDSILGRKNQEDSCVLHEAAERWIGHYSSAQKILVVGDGDFSFSSSLADAFVSAPNITATSLNSLDFLKKNYGRALSNINNLKEKGSKVIHDVDAMKMASHAQLKGIAFDRVIFNFPHAGFFPKESRQVQLSLHRTLVSGFLRNAVEMMEESSGEIHITHKANYGFHREWEIESLGRSYGLVLIDAVPFDIQTYPGYRTKYGFGGDRDFDCNPSETYMFGFGSSASIGRKKKKKRRRKRR